MIETVPTFISSKQLSSILRHAIALRARDEQGSNSVLSVVAKRIGTKALLPVVMDLFATAQKGDASEMEAYFHLVRLALRNADRATIPSLIKPVFAFFLDVFDLRHRLQKQAMDADVSDTSHQSSPSRSFPGPLGCKIGWFVGADDVRRWSTGSKSRLSGRSLS